MAMRTHQRKRVTIIIIMLSMLGCITSHSFTPVSGVKNSDDGDRESEKNSSAAVKKIRVSEACFEKSRVNKAATWSAKTML